MTGESTLTVDAGTARAREAIRHRLVHTLSRFPGEPATIAGSLAFGHVRGPQGDHCGCPLAMYLTAKMGVEVHVTETRAVVEHWAGNIEVALPGAVQLFVVQFDDGIYPNLIGPSTAGYVQPLPRIV